MEEREQTYNPFTKWLKARSKWWYILLGFLVFLGGLRLSLRSRFLLHFVKTKIESTADKSINGTLKIGSMKGDLWDEVTANDIRVVSKDTLIRLNSLKLSYNLIDLIRSPHTIQSISLEGLQANIKQEPDSSWNVLNLIPVDTTQKSSGGNIPLKLDRINLKNSSIGIYAPKMIPDSTVYINRLSIKSTFELKKAGYRFDLNDLSMQIYYRSLENPVTIKTRGKATENSYNLESLLIATGQTVINAGGHFKADSTSASYHFNMNGKSISWKNIKAVMSSYPVKDDADITLSLNGNYENTGLKINVKSKHIGRFQLESHFKIKPVMALTSLIVKADSINIAGLMNKSQYPEFKHANLKLTGDIPFNNYKKANLQGTADLSDFNFDHYHIDQSAMKIHVKNDSVRMDLNVKKGEEKLKMTADVLKPWNEKPEWNMNASIQHLNPAYWLADSSQVGNFNFTADVAGRGFKPGVSPWKIQLNLHKSTYQHIPVTKGSVLASITDQFLKSRTKIHLKQGEIHLHFNSHWAKKEPTYVFALQTQKLNLTNLGGIEKYPTSLNIRVKGSGKNFNFKNIDLKAHLNADSSIVNKETIQKLNADVTMKDSVLYLNNAVLKSNIADGTFKARQDIYHYDDPQNKLQYDLKIKDISSLAPLFGVQKLQTKGDLLGDIKMRDHQHAFIAELYLNDIRYNTFSINKLKGQMVVNLTKHPDYKAYLELTKPQIGTIELKDFKLHSSGEVRDTTAHGHYALNINIRNQTGADQKGDYFYSPDSINVSIDSLICRTVNRTLKLNKPGRIYYVNQTLRTDTLQISDGDNTMLRLHLNRLNSNTQQGFFDAKNLDVGAIQKVFLSKSSYGGKISGHADFDVVNQKVTLHSNLLVAGLSYEDVKIDTVDMKLHIDKGQLTANGLVKDKGVKLLDGEANIPFRLGNPTSFDTTFFNQPVHGYLKMKPLKLSDFKNLLSRLGWKDATGTAEFNGELAGKAGSPDLKGKFVLSNTEFSKVGVDTAMVRFRYDQSHKQIAFHGKVVSMKQTAAEINGTFPFSVNLKQFKVVLPQESDSVKARINTNNFNLAALNEFLSPQQVNRLSGVLNGQINVSGTIGTPEMSGNLKLSNGAVGVTPANIDIKNVSADLAFEPHKIVLKTFTMKSGGQLTASGDIMLNGYQTKNVNIKLSADHFRAMNTRNYKAVVSMNTDISGSLDHPKLTGDLTVNNGTIYLDNFGTKSVETVHLNQQKSYSDISLYDSLDVDMNLSINRNFWLRNRTSPEMAIELNGKVDISKKPSKELKMFGSFSSNQGYATQLGKRFQLQTGKVTFSGDPTNPSLDIKTLYQLRQPNDISIYYIITGTVNDPKFNYDSNPKMDLKNIISYTLFGRPFNALLSWEQSFSGSSNGKQLAQSALMNLLIDRVESLATNKLGIDLIQIDNSNQASGNGTTIKAGKYITNKIFLAVLQQLGGNNPVSQVILEYYLRKNLELVLTQSENSRTGIDVLWKYDY